MSAFKVPSSGLSATFSRTKSGRRHYFPAFSRYFQREKVPAGRMRASKLLNTLALFFFLGATVMLGKSCWITLKAEVSQILLERAFTQAVATGENVKPWGWADTWPVADLRIPRLGAAAIVLHGATAEALAFGPVYLPDTARIGERGTTVIAAHRDTHFAFLRDVAVNDHIAITRDDGLVFTYQITALRVAKWNATGIDRHAVGHKLVLSTCYPFDGVTRSDDRFIVEAELMN